MSSKKNNLMILHPDMSYGGAERQLLNLISGLARNGKYNLSVALYYRRGMLQQELEKIKKIQLIDLEFDRKWFFSRVILLKKVIAERNIKTVYSLLEGPNLLSVSARLLGSRHNVVWGYRVSDFDKFEFGLKGFLVSQLLKAFFGKVDLIIANSQAGAQHLTARNFDKKKIKVIPNGIDINRFQPNRIQRVGYQKELGIKPGQFVVGQVGRIVRWKGHDTFLRAAAVLKETSPNTAFVIVGSGDPSWLETLHKLSDQLGLEDSVLWLKPSSDVSRILNMLDVLTVCSGSGEGFPNIVGEAMAVGTAVVGTDVGETANLLQDVGMVFPSGNHKRLAEIWKQLASHPELREKISTAAKIMVHRLYAIDRMVKDTETTLDSVLEEKLGCATH